MDDNTALERQIGIVLDRMGGPEPTFDALAIARTAATQSPRWRFQTMVSAARFLVAGAIVALFGGFLLAGMSTTQPREEQLPLAAASATPSPAADTTEQPVRSDILPGVDLVTEEVEPGVYRVLSDGTGNDLAIDATVNEHDAAQVVAGQDGSVWIRDRAEEGDDRLFRLGVPGSVDASGLHHVWPDLSVAADDTLWALRESATMWGTGTGEDQLVSLADGQWVPQTLPGGVTVTGVETPPDGSLWASWAAGTERVEACDSGRSGRLTVAQLVDGEWVEEDVEPVTLAGDGGYLAIGADGTTLLATSYENSCRGDAWVGVVERDEGSWTPSITIDPDKHGIGPMVVGPDGTAWAYLSGPVRPWGPRLLHRRGGDWEILGDDGLVPMLTRPQSWGSSLTVSPDGRLWVALPHPAVVESHRDTGQSIVATLDGPCAGVLSFDGSTWRHHLGGACASDVSAAPNGNVWVTARDWDREWTAAMAEGDPDRTLRIEDAAAVSPRAGIYVITPEAVAGME